MQAGYVESSQARLDLVPAARGNAPAQKALWRPSKEVARRHVGTWRYLASVEGDFRIETDQRGVLLFSHESALGTTVSGTLLPQEKKWLEASLCTSGGEEAGVARVRYSEKTESMMYAYRPPGSQEFRPPTAGYRAMTSQEANRVSAESAVTLANKASRILEKGLASCSAGSWQLAKRDLNCVLQDLEAGADIWEDGRIRAELVASGKCLAVTRLRSLYAEALAGLAECCLKGQTPAKAQEALELAERAIGKDPGCLEALLQKGLALLELGRPSEAEGILQEGLHAEGSAVLARSAPECQEVLEQLESFLDDEDLLQQVQKLRESGNEHVRQGHYADAAWCYEDCLQVLWGRDLIYPSEVKERAKRQGTGLWRQLRTAETAVVTNLSLCCLQGQLPDWPPSPERAIQLCEIALAYDAGHVKAMRRMAHALCALHRYEEAEARLTQAARLRPKDVAIRQDLNRTRRQSEEVCRRAKEWEKEAFRDMFDRLPTGFATPDEAASSRWPDTQFPSPLGRLGTDEVQDYVSSLSETLEQEGDSAYMMELLYTIRHVVETQFGEGAGRQLPRIVLLVQGLTRGTGMVKTHEPGKGQRCLAARLDGLSMEQPLHDINSRFAWCQSLASQGPELLRELQAMEKRQAISWEEPGRSIPDEVPSWCCTPLVRRGVWVAQGQAFLRTSQVLSAVEELRPYEAGFARVGAGAQMQHEANTNFVLTLHLVLQLGRDGQYSAEVGEQHATLTQGGVLVFDPTFVHTVENASEAEMYLFYCHFYHPQITEVERYALLFLTQLMERLQTTGLVKSSSLAPAPAVDVYRALKFAA